MQGRLYSKASINKASINYSREKSCVCGKHCGLPDYQDRCRPSSQKRIFTHEGVSSSAHAHNIVQEVEVHGWLLSGFLAVKKTILCCSFLTLVANK